MARSKRITHAATAIIAIAVLAVMYSLYFARSLLVPIAFAILFDFLLSPLVRVLGKLKIPSVAAAALVMLSLIGVLVATAYELRSPVEKFLVDAPESVSKAQVQLGRFLQPLQRVSDNAAKVASVTGSPGGGVQPAQVVVVGPSMVSRLAGTSQRFIGGLLQVLLLLFFLLAGGDLFLEKTISLLPLLQDKKKAVRIAREIESAVSVYLIANLGINVAEGIIVGVALWALGLPNALLWGTIIVGVEFIPYIGAIVMISSLSLAALATFDDLTHILLVPIAYIVANFIMGNIVTTLVLGRRLALNSVALFIGLAFWFWIWGIPGAFIGVPLMSVIKICCDHIESLAPIGEFLGARNESPRAIVIADAPV